MDEQKQGTFPSRRIIYEREMKIPVARENALWPRVRVRLLTPLPRLNL